MHATAVRVSPAPQLSLSRLDDVYTIAPALVGRHEVASVLLKVRRCLDRLAQNIWAALPPWLLSLLMKALQSLRGIGLVSGNIGRRSWRRHAF
jgi:hypothetical protein